jgi:hypothetical protein
MQVEWPPDPKGSKVTDPDTGLKYYDFYIWHIDGQIVVQRFVVKPHLVAGKNGKVDWTKSDAPRLLEYKGRTIPVTFEKRKEGWVLSDGTIHPKWSKTVRHLIKTYGN